MTIPVNFQGTHIFVWQVDECGGAEVVAQKAKALGVDGVIVKFADGSLAGDPVSQKFMNDFKNIVRPLKAAGLKVGGWMYQYLTDVDGEVEACVQVANAGADFIVLDGEDEVQGKNSLVAEFGQKLRAKLPSIPLGFSSFAIANYHAQVPFAEYAAFVDVMMPQVYWADMGYDVSVAFNLSAESYKPFGKPIAPTGQAYGTASAADVAQFVAESEQAGYEHVSWWDFQHATADQFKAISTNLLPAPKPAPAQKPVANDVPVGAWYEKPVAFVMDKGFMVGDGNGNFRPNEPLTRAEMAEILYAVFHQKE